MKRVTEKAIRDFTDKNFDKKMWDPKIEGEPKIECYTSKIDGSYVCFTNNVSDIKWLLKKGITEYLQSAHESKNTMCLGFNPSEQKWYGWSHRAVFGYGVGSSTVKGNCGWEYSGDFTAVTLDDAKQMAINFAKSVS